MANSHTLVCEILTSETALDAIAAEWRELHTAMGKSVFTDYDFFRIWWDTIGKHGPRKLHVVTARENGKLVGVLPLSVTRKKGLRLLHAGGHKAFYCCDLIAANDDQALQLWKTAKASPHYDFADIRDVYPDSACYTALSAMGRRRDITDAWYLRTEAASGKDWLASLPGRTRRDHVRYMRRLEKKGPVRFEVCKDEPLPRDVIENMVKQKLTWASTNEKQGLFDGSSDVVAYFQNLLEAAAKQQRLMLSWLKCGDDTVAYFLWFPYRDVLRGYIITHDPAWSYYSPGNVILALSICWGIDNGLKSIDIAQGGGSYKAKFCNEKRHCAEFTFAGSPQGKILELAFINARKALRLVRGDKEEMSDADLVETGDEDEKKAA